MEVKFQGIFKVLMPPGNSETTHCAYLGWLTGCK